MRVNVYAEEITDRIEIVTTKADTGATFVGLRFYLKTHEDMLPPRHPDDDSSAVTFWVKSTKEGFKHKDVWPLCSLLEEAVSLLEEFDVEEDV